MKFIRPKPPRREAPRIAVTITLAVAALACMSPAGAAPFEIAVLPSRFELSAKSSARVGQSLEIRNLAGSPTEVNVRTLDWKYSESGALTFVDELLPDSCRPWVTIERRTVRVAARSTAPFRFQIDVPPNAPRRECRFMLAIEGAEPAYQALVQGGAASLSLPVEGRLAIAVYVAVNGAEPRLELTGIGVRTVNGHRTPVVTVRNSGDAHGRLDGSLDVVDAKGLHFEYVPDATPILPGQTRTLALSPQMESNSKTPDVVYPLKASGTLDWDNGGFKIDAELK